MSRSVTIILSEEERLDLAALETIISAGKEAFKRVGKALLEIRDKKLYRAEHKTFDDYCQKRWGFQRAHGYRLIEAAKLAEKLAPMSPTGDKLEIASEREARAIDSVLKSFSRHWHDEIIKRVHEEAAKTSSKQITESLVSRIAHLVKREKEAEEDWETPGGAPEDEDGDESEDAEESSTHERSKQEEVLARAAQRVAPPKLHPLLRSVEHHRLGRKDSRKIVSSDMEDDKLRDAAEKLRDDLLAEVEFLSRLLAG